MVIVTNLDTIVTGMIDVLYFIYGIVIALFMISAIRKRCEAYPKNLVVIFCQEVLREFLRSNHSIILSHLWPCIVPVAFTRYGSEHIKSG